MKHIRKINELFGLGDKIRSSINKDEGVAKEILNRITNSLNIEEDKGHGNYPIHTFQFDLDGFNIKSERKSIHSGRIGENNINEEGPHSITTIDYNLYIDGEIVKSSDYINKKIWKKIESIVESQSPISDFRKAFRTK